MNDEPTAPPAPTALAALLADREWVRAMARSLVRDPSRADDLEQQAWLAALERPPPDARSPRGWFATVLRRGAGRGRRDDFRRDRRERVAARPEAAPAAVDVVAAAEWHERVVRTVLELAEPYRTTILLRYFEDLPPREVAARMGVPVETVRSRAQRGLAQLRARFDSEAGGRRAWAPALLVLGAGGAGRAGAAEDAAWEGEARPRPVGVPPAGAGPLAALSSLTRALSPGAWASLSVGAVLLVGGLAVALSRETGIPPVLVAGEPEGARSSSPEAIALAAGPRRADAGEAEAGRPVPATASRVLGGRVLGPDGAPVAGARVVLVPLRGGGPNPMAEETVSDAEGRYAFERWPGTEGSSPTEVMVFAMASGLATAGFEGLDPAGWNPLALAVPASGVAAFDLHLEPALTLRGRVIDHEGAPVAGATVEAWWRSKGGASLLVARPLATTMSDAEGRFAVPGWSRGQAHDLLAYLPTGFPSRVSDVSVGPLEGGGYEVFEDLRLPAAKHVSVLVTTEDGAPIPGAIVDVIDFTYFLDTVAFDFTAEGLPDRLRPFELRGVTGPDGRVDLGPVPVQDLQISARRPEALWGNGKRLLPDERTLSIKVPALPSGRRESPATATKAPSTTHLRVLGPDGGPVARVRFTRWVADAHQRVVSVGAGSGEGIELGPAQPLSRFVEVHHATGADGRALPLGAVVIPFVEGAELEARLGPEVVVEGVLEVPEGCSARGSLVRARPARWDGLEFSAAHGVAEARVDERGAFRLGGLGGEVYRLAVVGPPDLVLQGETSLAPSGGGTVTLRLVRRPKEE